MKESNPDLIAKHILSCRECSAKLASKYQSAAIAALGAYEERLGRKLSPDERATFSATTLAVVAYIDAGEIARQTVMAVLQDLVDASQEPDLPTMAHWKPAVGQA